MELVNGAPDKFMIKLFLADCATMSQETRKRKFADHRRFLELPRPSGYGGINKTATGEYEGWPKYQQDPNLEVMCLRPPECTFINISIMDPVFAEITGVLKSGDPEPQDLQMRAELAAVMPRHFGVEGSRRDAINDILNKYITLPNGGAVLAPRIIGTGTKESDGTAADALNVEYKNEKGLGSADSYMENVGTYTHFWANSDGPTKHSCPWLMVESNGQEMGLSGGAWACGYPCAQPLSTNVPFVAVPQDEDMTKVVYAWQ